MRTLLKTHIFSAALLFLFLTPFWPVSAEEALPGQNGLANQLPELGQAAQVSLITYSPGDELYQAFGHSAIRIRDDLLGLDRLYNFGVFDFETANFYVKFAHGDLRYQLAVSPSEEEIRLVGAYGQGVTEIPLNLSRAQRQDLFAALEVNLLPENRFYRYDFILDNCSTRPRDSIEHVTGSPIVVRDAGRRTFREMLNPYFDRIPWAGLGVSLLMGAGVDRLASPREACFLPADLERAVQSGRNGEQPLAGEKKEIFAPGPLAQTFPFLTPLVVFWSGGTIWFLFWLVRKKGHATWPTALLLMIFGLLGIFVFVLSCWSRLWVLKANYNLWWLFPLHFPAGLWLVLTRHRLRVLNWYLWFAFLSAMFFICFSPWLPQKFNPAIFPLLVLLGWRCGLELFPISKGTLVYSRNAAN